jgi:hypothetical protein
MAELKTEAIQPDPAATSVSNGQAVKNEGGDSSVPASIEGTETVTKIRRIVVESDNTTIPEVASSTVATAEMNQSMTQALCPPTKILKRSVPR